MCQIIPGEESRTAQLVNEFFTIGRALYGAGWRRVVVFRERKRGEAGRSQTLVIGPLLNVRRGLSGQIFSLVTLGKLSRFIAPSAIDALPANDRRPLSNVLGPTL